MSDDIHNWVDDSPYAQALGMTLAALGDDSATIALPFIEANANPGNALHGGVSASTSMTAAGASSERAGGKNTPGETLEGAARLNSSIDSRVEPLRPI